jgi:hypothetical protein
LLGNPWVVHKDGTREQVIERFRLWLWEIVQDGTAGKFGSVSRLSAESAGQALGFELTARVKDPAQVAYRMCVWRALVGLVARYQRGETLRLVCYCKPLACHAEVIGKCVEWLSKKNYE